MENKPFEKSVYFYRMFPNPSFGINAPTESQRLHQMFERIFSTGCMIYPYSDFHMYIDSKSIPLMINMYLEFTAGKKPLLTHLCNSEKQILIIPHRF